jgi:ribulose-5-phosphate 4-epimerase/fuculose-1-phosphate aldolase
LLVCDMDGGVVHGNGAPAASAKHIHSPIHRLVPHATVLLHTHQPWSTALTMTCGGRLEMALQSSARFHTRIAYDYDYDGVALSDSVGERMAKLIGHHDVIFLGNHGVMTVAPTAAQAFDDLYFLERAAKTQILAQSTGRPLAMLEPALLQQTFEQTVHERMELGYPVQHFAALRRMLDRSDGSYRS